MIRIYRSLPMTIVVLVLILGALPLLGGATPDSYPLEHLANQELVQLVDRAAELVEKEGMAACDGFREEKGEWRLGDGYVFMIDMEGVSVCNPGHPHLEGRNVLEMRDPDGKELGRLFRQRANSPSRGGWVHYLWPRPGDNVLTWKSSYVRRIAAPDGTEYMVACGVHGLPVEKQFVVERVDDAVALIEAKGKEAFPVIESPSEGFEFLDTYVFITNWDGVEVVNPAFPDLKGESVLDVKDHEGTYPVQEMLKALETQETAWVSYFWPRPRSTRPAKKDVYVRRAEAGGEKYVVGAGLYSEYAPKVIETPGDESEQNP